MKHVCQYETETGDDCWYGNFRGGDPRCFEPDHEGLMRHEYASWRQACEAFDNGFRPELPPACRPIEDASGAVVGHITMAVYGLGINHRSPIAWRELPEPDTFWDPETMREVPR